MPHKGAKSKKKAKRRKQPKAHKSLTQAEEQQEEEEGSVNSPGSNSTWKFGRPTSDTSQGSEDLQDSSVSTVELIEENQRLNHALDVSKRVIAAYREERRDLMRRIKGLKGGLEKEYRWTGRLETKLKQHKQLKREISRLRELQIAEEDSFFLTSLFNEEPTSKDPQQESKAQVSQSQPTKQQSHSQEESLQTRTQRLETEVSKLQAQQQARDSEVKDLQQKISFTQAELKAFKASREGGTCSFCGHKEVSFPKKAKKKHRRKSFAHKESSSSSGSSSRADSQDEGANVSDADSNLSTCSSPSAAPTRSKEAQKASTATLRARNPRSSRQIGQTEERMKSSRTEPEVSKADPGFGPYPRAQQQDDTCPNQPRNLKQRLAQRSPQKASKPRSESSANKGWLELCSSGRRSPKICKGQPRYPINWLQAEGTDHSGRLNFISASFPTRVPVLASTAVRGPREHTRVKPYGINEPPNFVKARFLNQLIYLHLINGTEAFNEFHQHRFSGRRRFSTQERKEKKAECNEHGNF